MTTTYDPHHPLYVDEADVRLEMASVFDVCQSCRACTHLCSTFPHLFEIVDAFDDGDAGRMTPAEQDDVADQCFQCKLCLAACPYQPGSHDLAIDFPRLMQRAAAMRVSNGQVPARRRIAARLVGRTELLGSLRRLSVGLADKLGSAMSGPEVRRTIAVTFGLSGVDRLPPLAKQRFTRWFRTRASGSNVVAAGTLTVFPTCLVEHREVQIGHDFVEVAERNGVACAVTSVGCCGAPLLHAGEVERFRRVAERNVQRLAAELDERGGDLVVLQPTCTHVLRHDSVVHVADRHREAAELVAARTTEAADYLVAVHRSTDGGLDTEFGGDLPTSIDYRPSAHRRALGDDRPSAELLRLTGARVDVVEQAGEAATDADLVASEIGLEARAAGEGGAETPSPPRPAHPVSVLARAYHAERS